MPMATWLDNTEPGLDPDPQQAGRLLASGDWTFRRAQRLLDLIAASGTGVMSVDASGISRLDATGSQLLLALLAQHDGFQPYMKMANARPQQDHHGLLENSDWSTLHLWQNGAAVDEHIARCPNIFRAVKDHVPLCHIGPRAPSVTPQNAMQMP